MMWTKETDARLLECIENNWTASQVGREFGISRNAVLGRAYRLGVRFGKKGFADLNLCGRLRSAYLAKKSLSEIASEFKTTTILVRDVLRRMHKKGLPYRQREGRRRSSVILSQPRRRRPPQEVEFGTVTFRDLTDWHCKFISGHPRGLDTLYCGAEALPNKSYCAEHWNRIFPTVTRDSRYGRLGPHRSRLSNI